MVYTVIALIILGGACFVEELRDCYRDVGRKGFLKCLMLVSGMFMLTGCLSFSSTTTERPDHSVPVVRETRTETVYVNENGTRVRRVVTVDEQGRRYYVENGQRIYVDYYEY
jgi:uncharacterized lipoprotein YajG